MKCRDCYIWQVRLDNLIDRWKSLPKQQFFVDIPNPTATEIFSDMSLYLIEEKNYLYEIRNKSCPVKGCLVQRQHVYKK